MGETNLGTINTIRNGLATLNECETQEMEGVNCGAGGHLDGLNELLNFTTTNQCLASQNDFEEAGITIPNCPGPNTDLSGLDNTHPTVGTFAIYTGENDSFIANLASSYLNSSSVGRFNLILPKDHREMLKSRPELLNILNSSRVNIVEVDTMPSVGRWMQDSFQFTSLNGKPAIYQLSHKYEAGTEFEHRLACDLARKCDIPYYVPSDLVESGLEVESNLNGGGNLEVLPGGTFYTGTIQSEGYPFNNPEGAELPYSSPNQDMRRKALEASGNSVLDLDVSFLKVAHVDEIINIVKTNKAAPCDYAVLMASPRKAFELMEAAAMERDGSGFRFNLTDILFPLLHAEEEQESEVTVNRCTGHDYMDLYNEGAVEVIRDERVSEVYSKDCINGEPIEEYVGSSEYEILKRENLSQTLPVNISQIMEDNKAALIIELQRTTACQSPEIIEIPVFFRDGLSYTPDLVNGVVETSGTSPSSMLLPRSYFEPFDSYVSEQLQQVGVKSSFIHDMGYHLRNGEVHCGTNSARICNL